jgi:hypothetical protein
VPDILTIRNGATHNPQLVEYQIRHDRSSAWNRIAEYLDLLAQHTPVKKKSVSVSASCPTVVKEPSKKKDKSSETHTTEDSERYRLEKKRELMRSVSQELTQFESVVERLCETREEKREQLTSLVEAFKNMNVLAMRLASSLSLGMGITERSQYRTSIERNSFNSLGKIVGVEATGITSKASRAKAKKITPSQIVDIISKHVIAEHGGLEAFLVDAQKMSESCGALVDALRPKTLSEASTTPDRIRSWIDTHWPIHASSKQPSSTLALTYYELLSESLPMQNIKGLVAELREELLSTEIAIGVSLSEMTHANQQGETPIEHIEVI